MPSERGARPGGRAPGGMRVPLSPSQSATFAMARVLILLSVWGQVAGPAAPVEFERAMVIDFASQFPRAFRDVVPEISAVLRAYRQQQEDLSDVFAGRRFDVLRERFGTVITDLMARELVREVHAGQKSAAFVLTPVGTGLSRQFSSALSFSFRAVTEVLCEAWRRKSIDQLMAVVRTALPREAQRIAELSLPIPHWIEEEQWENA